MKKNSEYTRPKIIKYIIKYVSDMKLLIISSIVVSFISVFVPITNPRFFQILIDDVMLKGEVSKFRVIVFGLLGIYIARLLLDWINLILSNKILNKFIYNIRTDLWTRYVRLDSKISSLPASELKMRLIDDVDSLSNFIKDQVVDYVSSYFLAILASVFAFIINIKFALICFAVIPIVFLINYYIGILTRKINEKIRKVSEEYVRFEYSALSTWKEVKANVLEETIIIKFMSFRKQIAKLGYTSIRYWFYNETINDFKANYLSKAMVYCVGLFFVINNSISLGNLILFASYYELLFTAVDTIQSKEVSLKTLNPYYARIFEILADKQDETMKLKITGINNIEIHNLHLSLNNKRILQNVNFNIRSGDRVALYGKSGAGKSVLMKTILGFFDYEQGNILFNGISINDLEKSSMYDNVIAVMQEPFLFNMSIRDNLLLAKQDASDKDLESVCQKVNILYFINSLPSGFNTIIGEGGVKLSGGQKQKLAIARALLKYSDRNYPCLIILDEVTSSLDSISESFVKETLKNYKPHDIIISISHRQSMLEESNKKIFVENGSTVDIYNSGGNLSGLQ